MLRNSFVYKLQWKLSCPKSARKGFGAFEERRQTRTEHMRTNKRRHRPKTWTSGQWRSHLTILVLLYRLIILSLLIRLLIYFLCSYFKVWKCSRFWIRKVNNCLKFLNLTFTCVISVSRSLSANESIPWSVFAVFNHNPPNHTTRALHACRAMYACQFQHV